MSVCMQAFDRWLIIKPHVVAGKSDYQIAALVGISRQRVQSLRVKFHGNDEVRPPNAWNITAHDWKAVQAAYDAGTTWRDLAIQFGFGQRSIILAAARGDIKLTRSLSESMKLSYARGRSKSGVMSLEQRQKLSRQQSINNRGGKSKWYAVSGVKVQGTWERDLAIKFCEWGLSWKRVNGRRAAWPYFLDGKLKHYTPDFYLPKFKVWIEVKGYWWGNDKNKMAAVIRAYPHRRIVLVEKIIFHTVLKSAVIPEIFMGR